MNAYEQAAHDADTDLRARDIPYEFRDIEPGKVVCEIHCPTHGPHSGVSEFRVLALHLAYQAWKRTAIRAAAANPLSNLQQFEAWASAYKPHHRLTHADVNMPGREFYYGETQDLWDAWNAGQRPPAPLQDHRTAAQKMTDGDRPTAELYDHQRDVDAEGQRANRWHLANCPSLHGHPVCTCPHAAADEHH